MAEPQSAPAASPAPRPPLLTPELIRYIATIAVLGTLVIVLAATGQRDGMNTVLGGLVGFATSGHPGGSSNPATVTAATMGLAFGAGALGHLLGS